MPSGDLEQSLRADIEAYVAGRLSGLQEEVARLQSQFNEAFTRLLERMDGGSESDAALAVAVSDHLRHARDEGIERAASESARARAASDVALVKAAVDEIETQHAQADILNVLVNRAAAFAPRVAFFVIKNERATGWRARGLAGTVGDDAVRELSLPASTDTLLSEVTRTRTSWSGGPGAHAEDHSIYSRFGEEPPQRLVAVPMVAREKAVAVLYADSAGQDSDAVNLEALETLVKVAGMAVELLASRRHAPADARAAESRAAQAPAAEPAREEPPAPQPEPEPEPSATPAEPQASYESFTQPSTASESFAQPSTPPAQFGWGEEAAPAAAPAPQPEPTPSYVPEPAPQPEVSPLGASRRFGGADMDFPVDVGEEEKRYHSEAWRFARLLVSEIKLYNEQKVREGRDAGDLYNRLREDIDRSRQMYDKRVRPEVAGRYDYFHHELVKALAGGDASRLGEGYPGT